MHANIDFFTPPTPAPGKVHWYETLMAQNITSMHTPDHLQMIAIQQHTCEIFGDIHVLHILDTVYFLS